MRIQGGSKQEQYFTRALLPYLDTNIQEMSKYIKEINQYFVDLPRPSSKTKNRITSVGVNCHLCKKEFKTKNEIRFHIADVHNDSQRL